MNDLIVVCADDEVAVLEHLKRKLQPNDGCRVEMTLGLDEALTLLQAWLSQSSSVVLITVDEIVPEMAVNELHGRIQRSPHSPNLLWIQGTSLDALQQTLHPNHSPFNRFSASSQPDQWQMVEALLYQLRLSKLETQNRSLQQTNQKLMELATVLEEQICDRSSALNEEIRNREQTEILMQQHLTELTEWQSRYETAGQASGQILYEWDAETDSSTWGPNTEVILGYTVGEMPRTLGDWLTLIHPDDRPVIAAKADQVITARASFRAEYRVQRKDGSYIWVEDRSQFLPSDANALMRSVGFINDISSRKQVAIALQESEAQFRTLVENLQVGVLLQGPNAEILISNSKALDLLGLTEDQLLGRTSFDPDWNVIHENGLPFPGSEHPVPQAIATRQPIRNVVMGVYRPAPGDRIWLLVNADPQLNEQGDVHQVLCTFSDISDRKRIELELQQAKESAEAANLAKGAFLTNMSHELRTPLNAVLGFTQMLDADPNLNGQQREYLNIILRSGEHLLKLINDVLEMSKIDAGRVTLEETEFDLYRLLTSLIETLQLKAAAKDLQLNLELAAETPHFIKTDEKKLRQILVNLLNNAIKFTSLGSVILRAKGQPTPLDPLPPPATPSQTAYTIWFEVEDTGPGIAAAEMPQLFNPFVQTSVGQQSGQGTGLGLAISRRFVELMGGKITVHSEVSVGATFRFYIPVQVMQPQKPQAEEETSHIIGLQPDQPSYRILVVEDQITNRMLVTRLLSKVGFAVEEAKNGEEAIAQWERWQPHLILMDMQMPVMNGYEATRAIRLATAKAEQATPTIVALTASVFEEQRSQIMTAGCDDVVSKPFKVKELLLTIAQHLGVRYIYG